MVRAEEAKQKYISRIQSVAQKLKKITKSQFQIAAKKMIKENNHVYTAKFVKLATDISNIGTISLSAVAKCIKSIIAFFTDKTPDHLLSTKTFSRWKKNESKNYPTIILAKMVDLDKCTSVIIAKVVKDT
ncbi:13311_t:CDS:2, partial [Dentiscutata erythropus]